MSDPKTCCLCGAKPLYKVRDNGYCAVHRVEASAEAAKGTRRVYANDRWDLSERRFRVSGRREYVEQELY